MSQHCYLTLVVVGASLLALASGCPEPTGWFYSSVTKLCYRGLLGVPLNFSLAQARCNSMRSNLFQLNPGDNTDIFTRLLDQLYRIPVSNTTEFRGQRWIGLTDRAKLDTFVFLNGALLTDLANPFIVCPSSNLNCRPANRCVYMNLDRRGISNEQFFMGNCADSIPPVCYAPVGGTDKFDKVPPLGASSTTASMAVLAVATCMLAAVRSLVSC